MTDPVMTTAPLETGALETASLPPMTCEEFVASLEGHLPFSISDESLSQLSDFADLVAERNEVMNLVGPLTVPHYWSRHALDSAQVLAYAPTARTFADLGAGAGFPGVVLAILLKSTTGGHVHLVDSLTKRCKFLDEVVEKFDLPATVHNARAESLNLKVDVVTARAVAPMAKLLGFAEPYFKAGAKGVFLKGEQAQHELIEASKTWRFDHELLPSYSDPRGRVVRLGRVRRGR